MLVSQSMTKFFMISYPIDLAEIHPGFNIICQIRKKNIPISLLIPSFVPSQSCQVLPLNMTLQTLKQPQMPRVEI